MQQIAPPTPYKFRQLIKLFYFFFRFDRELKPQYVEQSSNVTNMNELPHLLQAILQIKQNVFKTGGQQYQLQRPRKFQTENHFKRHQLHLSMYHRIITASFTKLPSNFMLCFHHLSQQISDNKIHFVVKTECVEPQSKCVLISIEGRQTSI